MPFGKSVALVIVLLPASAVAQELLLVEPNGRHLLRQKPHELAIEAETDPACQIGSDLLTDTIVDVLRRGGLVKKEPAHVGQDFFALRVAVGCKQRVFLVEVDFVDRVAPVSPGRPAGAVVRYLPSYRNFGLVESRQRTLAAAKRSVEAAVNDYLEANFKTR
jgi:hypothetical protein